jgi:hypothetical protein
MYRKSTTQSSFLYTGSNIYNLSYELRDYSNYVILKLKCTEWLLQQAADYDNIIFIVIFCIKLIIIIIPNGKYCKRRVCKFIISVYILLFLNK